MTMSNILQRNNVVVSGRGQDSMVFSHGFGCDQKMWRFVAPAFEDDFRVVLFDHVGCGGSQIAAYDERRHATLQGYADDLIEVIHAARAGGCVFVGHSVGATIGLLAAIRQPALFSRLVMVCASPHYLNDPPHYMGGLERADVDSLLAMMDANLLGWTDFLAPVAIGDQDPGGMTEELRASFCAADPYVTRRFAIATFLSDYRGELHRVSVPSLIIQCARDAIAPVGVGQFMHERMPGSALVVIDASGHCPHMTHPSDTTGSIRRYLAKP